MRAGRFLLMVVILAAIGGGVWFAVTQLGAKKQAGAAPDGAAAGAAAGAPAGGPGGAGGQMPPPAVSYMEATPTSVPISYDLVGNVEPSQRVEIRARIQGFLDKRLFEEGALVHEGQLLYKIDPRSYQADLEIAQAQVEQAKSQLNLAQREWDRLDKLRNSGVISQSELDKQAAARQEAEASLNLAKANEAKAQLELSYTTIEAPLTGLIDKTYKDVGSLVDSGNNSLLTSILQVDPIYVSFQMGERDYRNLTQDMQRGVLRLSGQVPWVQLTLVDGTKYPQDGSINFQNPTLDTQTGTVQYRAQFSNADGELKPGQFVRVKVGGWIRPDTFLVPQIAVAQAPTGPYVMVVGPDGTAQTRQVELGAWHGDSWIVLSGLNKGDRVIVAGGAKVQPGAPVNATQQQAAAGSAPTTATGTINKQQAQAPPAAVAPAGEAAPTAGSSSQMAPGASESKQEAAQ